jgi:2-polyprenyl-3-methyl-5-hydroxy-6-metoxy-1,4-benzoquinol methylase
LQTLETATTEDIHRECTAPQNVSAHIIPPSPYHKQKRVMNSERRTAIISRRFDRRYVSRAAAMNPVQRTAIDDFRRLLDGDEFHFAPTICPCGSSADATVLATTERYGLPLTTVTCDQCGTLRFDPYFDEESVTRFYMYYYQNLYNRVPDLPAYFTRQSLYGIKVARALDSLNVPTRRILEVGCGAGGALAALERHGWQITGCELDGPLIEYGRSRGVANIHYGSVDAIVSQPVRQEFDVIYSHHVFEHVLGPERQLRAIKDLLRTQGLALHIVPDIMGIHRSLFPAGDALQYLHIAHVFNYTLKGLQMLAESVGMCAQRISPPRLATPWSHAAEMWIMFTHSPSACDSVTNANSGETVITYLRNTEKRFRYGLHVPQIINRLKTSVRPLTRAVQRFGRSKNLVNTTH